MLVLSNSNGNCFVSILLLMSSFISLFGSITFAKTHFSRLLFKNVFTMELRDADDGRKKTADGIFTWRRLDESPSRYHWSRCEMKIIPSTFSIWSFVSRFSTSTCFANLKTSVWNLKPGCSDVGEKFAGDVGECYSDINYII